MHVLTFHGAGCFAQTAECGDEGCEAPVRAVHISAQFQERSNEGEWTMVNRVSEARANCVWQPPIRNRSGIVDSCLQSRQIATAEGFVDPAKLLSGCAALSVRCHIRSILNRLFYPSPHPQLDFARHPE